MLKVTVASRLQFAASHALNVSYARKSPLFSAEIARLGALVAELQLRVAHGTESKPWNNESETVAELRAALDAERAGSSRLEIALASALSDNAALAASLHANDNSPTKTQRDPTPPVGTSTNICPIDSFLAE